MEVKRYTDITWKDLPRIETPFFASSAVRHHFSGPLGNQWATAGAEQAFRDFQPISVGQQPDRHRMLEWLVQRVERGEVVVVENDSNNPMRRVVQLQNKRWTAAPALPIFLRQEIERCLEVGRQNKSLNRGLPEEEWWKKEGGSGSPIAPEHSPSVSGGSSSGRRTPPPAPPPPVPGDDSTSFNTITNAATTAPDKAPLTVNMSQMQSGFQQQWDNSFPGGVSQEHGGTVVADTSGKMSMVNAGAGDQGSFSPNLTVGPDKRVGGIFHTHPYDSTEGGHTGVSLSGGDAAYMINKNHNFIIAQSGSDQFMYIRTANTPANVDFTALNDAQNARIGDLISTGHSFSDASKIAAKETAQNHGLAYYEGSNGLFTRVSP
jgi:hypothetical protein